MWTLVIANYCNTFLNHDIRKGKRFLTIEHIVLELESPLLYSRKIY